MVVIWLTLTLKSTSGKRFVRRSSRFGCAWAAESPMVSRPNRASNKAVVSITLFLMTLSSGTHGGRTCFRWGLLGWAAAADPSTRPGGSGRLDWTGRAGESLAWSRWALDDDLTVPSRTLLVSTVSPILHLSFKRTQDRKSVV